MKKINLIWFLIISFFLGITIPNGYASQIVYGNLYVQYNVSAELYCDDTSCYNLTVMDVGDISEVNTLGDYLYGGATSGAVNLYVNETKLNDTIQKVKVDNATYADSASLWDGRGALSEYNIGNWSDDKSDYYTSVQTDSQIVIANTSMKDYTDTTFITQTNEGNLNVNKSDFWDNFNIASDLNNLIISDWTNISNKFITAVSNIYLYMSGTTITLNETYLNATIDARSDFDTDTHVAGDGVYLYNDSTTMYLNETKLNITIDDKIVTANSSLKSYVDTQDVNLNASLKEWVLLKEYYNDVANLTAVLDSVYVSFSNIVSIVGNFSAWNKAYEDLINKPTVLSNFTDDLGDRGYDSLSNFSNDVGYSTTAEIIAFGYYNATDFVITDYFTKTNILDFGYYNSSDFSISDYFTSSEVLAFNYYNASNFDINDYVTSAVLSGYNYYNSSDFSISDYYTKTQVDAIITGIGNFSAWDKDYNDLINKPTVFGNTTDEIFAVVNNGTFYLITNPDGYITNLSGFDTDDLGEGLTNKYDNSSWNESHADNKYLQTAVESLSSADDYISVDSPTGSVQIDFNESKLEVIYFLASSIQVVTGTGAGSLSDIQTYDQITYNVTEANSDFELIVNFTGITEFTTLLIRHKTDIDAGHSSVIQIWDYNTSSWEGYGYLIESTTSEIKTLGVYDSTDHVDGGVVQVRFYQDEGPPNVAHIHQFDWVALSKGFGTPVGQEIDPLSVHRDGTSPLTGDWDAGAFDITADTFIGNLSCSNITGATSELCTLINTDTNLTEADIATMGFTKIADNRSWNQSLADTLYRADDWDNFTGIPHATPSDGDITHFSYADEVYDWVIGLGYSTLSQILAFNYYNSTDFDITDYVTSAVLAGYGYYNSSDFSIGDYYTSAQTDTQIVNANTSMKGYVDTTFLTIANEGNLNVNSSTYWDGRGALSEFGIGNFSAWDKDYGDLINTPTALSEFTDDLGNRDYTHLTNFTDDILWTSGFNTTFDSRDSDTTYTNASFDLSQLAVTGDVNLGVHKLTSHDWTNVSVTESQISDLQSYLTSYLNLTQEDVQDYAFAALNGTETHITVTYQDATESVDFVVADDWWDELTDMVLADASIYIGDGSADPVARAITGDITLSNAGVVSVINTAGLDASNITTGTIDNARITLVEDEVPTLSSSWDNTMDADRLTGLDFLNNKIVLAGENISTGTVADVRIASTIARDTEVVTANTSMKDYVDANYPSLATIIAFGYYNASNFDIADYSTTAEADGLYAVLGYGDEWNKTYADTLYAGIGIDGTVTNIATGNGLTGGPITTTGTISISAITSGAGNYSYWDGNSWETRADVDTTYSAGNGISLSTTTFSVAGNTALTQDADGLSVTADEITDTQLAFNTGQHLTTTSNPTFNNVTITECIPFASGGKICSGS